jgi:hypothetical protein
MKRTYLAVSALALGATLLPPAAPLAGRAGTFGSAPLETGRLAVLARPVGESDWNLLVLEQLQPGPLCWQPREDGLIDAALNRFDFTGICGRYLDSNGYSLRVGAEDQGSRYRLRLHQEGRQILLQALTPDQPTVLVLGRGPVPRRDRDGFVAITLENGWQLERRTYGTTTLNHVYFAHANPLAVLISQASGSSGRNARPPLMPPPIGAAPLAAAGEGSSPFRPASMRSGGAMPPAGEGPIALQVIPYQGQSR